MPVWIDSRYVEADLKITTGLIEPHFMAGFSGGRKLICPGLAALETVRAWHGPAFLEHPERRLRHPGRQPGPRREHLDRPDGRLRFHRQRGDRRPAAAAEVRGRRHGAAFLEGCDFVRDVVTDTLPEPVDIVVTSSAGYPLDTTFYQSVKGMVGALPIVKPGGTIILAASLSEGIGSPEFQSLFDEQPEAGRVHGADPAARTTS